MHLVSTLNIESSRILALSCTRSDNRHFAFDSPGVAADIGHINTKSTVTGYTPENNGLDQCLKGSEIVLIPAGVPRKPGMTRDDLFNTNASIVRDLAKACAKAAPNANILVISNPVNSTVPICAEILKSQNAYNPKRLFGVTTLDVVRASRFISEKRGTDPADENITVIGGHSGATIVPLLSQSGFNLEGADLDTFINRVQFGGDEVVKAKDGAGSATLSMAMAGARFAESLLKAAQGEKGVVEPTFVDSPLFKGEGIDFFASKVELGPNGVEKIHEVGPITQKEQELLDVCKKDLMGNIAKGEPSAALFLCSITAFFPFASIRDEGLLPNWPCLVEFLLPPFIFPITVKQSHEATHTDLHNRCQIRQGESIRQTCLTQITLSSQIWRMIRKLAVNETLQSKRGATGGVCSCFQEKIIKKSR